MSNNTSKAVETKLSPAQKLEALKKAEAEMLAQLAAMQQEVKQFEAAEALNILKDAVKASFADVINGSDTAEDLQVNLTAMLIQHFPKVSKSTTGRSRSGGLIVKGYQAIIDAARADLASGTKIGITRDALVELTGASPVTVTAHMPKLPGFFRYSNGVFSTATPDEAQKWLDAKTTASK